MSGKLINLFPILAFIIGAALKTVSLMFGQDINATTAGLASIVSLVILMLVFPLITKMT